MKCLKCKKKAILNDPRLCVAHFLDYFEKKVKKTIQKFQLIKKKDKVIVATSGGKDSLTTLYVLKKLGYNVNALAIDEGIEDYRDFTLCDLKKFCEKEKIKYRIISFKKEFKKTLDEMLRNNEKLNPCTVCGALRRYLLNKYSKGYDVIATGHNLDDEAQAILMNFIRNQLAINARLGPKSGLIRDLKFTPRVKPLYFCTEKEVAVYSFLKGFVTKFVECSYDDRSFRSKIRDFLNEIQKNYPNFKQNIIKNYIKLLPKFKKYFSTSATLNYCINCGEPSKDAYCKACLVLREIKN